MSTCSIIEFRDGLAETAAEFGNAWGGAARIWNSLYNTYLKDPNSEYDSWVSAFTRNNGEPLWQLREREDIPFFERVVLVGTFDKAILRRENFSKFAGHLREFVAKYPAPGACHLNKWADFIEKSDAEAIAFHATSVSSSHWWIRDDDDDGRPYDLNRDNDHFEVYDYFTAADHFVKG